MVCVPDGFAAYARIFHPAYQLVEDDQLEAMPIDADQGVTMYADTINPNPEGRIRG